LRNRLLPLLGVALGFVMISNPLSAHHGTTAFEMGKPTVVKGTVTKFEFINPHVLIYLDAPGDKGGVQHWIAESSSNNHLSRGGYNKNSLQVGEQVMVTGHRAKNGAYTLELQCQECSVTDAHGKVPVSYTHLTLPTICSV